LPSPSSFLLQRNKEGDNSMSSPSSFCVALVAMLPSPSSFCLFARQ
jgi:hypothetical protein